MHCLRLYWLPSAFNRIAMQGDMVCIGILLGMAQMNVDSMVIRCWLDAISAESLTG